MDDQKETQKLLAWEKIIDAVRTPLSFFVLIGLVIASLVYPLLFGLKGNDLYLTIYAILGVLVLLIITVTILAFYKPEILFSTGPIKAMVVFPPTEKKIYNQLFDEFSDCDFYAFNPPFQVESAGSRIYKEALNTQEKRYISNVSSRYLFFDEKSYSKASDFFNDLSERIGKEKVEKYIKLLYLHSELDKPGFTFFLGKKKDRSTIILYPSAVMKGGIPRAVIYIEGAEDLLSILKDYFLSKWNEDNKLGENTQ